MTDHIRASDIARQLSDNPPNAANESNKTQPELALRPFRPFPVDALPAPIARFVRSVAGATSTDPSWAALAALVVMAGCIGNRVAVKLKRGWVEPAILWAALVGKSGSIKSIVLRLVARPLVELFKMEREEFATKKSAYAIGMERHNVEMTKWKKEQKNSPPRDPPLEPEKPKEKRVLVSDVTIEKLAALLGENPLGLLVVRDELAGLINSFDRYAGGKGSDLQAWLSMNDGSALLVDRKTDGSTFVERASVSLLGTIQPFTLESVFGVLEREAGLLARMLLACPPERPALWTEDDLPDAVAATWQDLLAALLALEPAIDDAGSPRPRLIGLPNDAKKLFVSWHDRHARQVAESGDDHLRSHWSKLKGTCARIALLFACADAVDGKNVSLVSYEHIERAIRVTEWLKQESARVYSGLGRSKEDRDRHRLLEWIDRRGGIVTVRDLTHGCWEYRGHSEAARAALDELVKLGVGCWVHPATKPAGGRPPEKFKLKRIDNLTITETPSDNAKSDGFGDGDGGDGGNGIGCAGAETPSCRTGKANREAGIQLR